MPLLLITAGSRRYGTRCSPPLWRDCTPNQRGDGPSLNWPDAGSRSALDGRFRQLLGISPIRYLTDWRMRMAQEMLATTETTIVAVARRVGYESEEVFSRAFKRFHGCAPSVWRNSLFSI